jgi:hypothetical protein
MNEIEEEYRLKHIEFWEEFFKNRKEAEVFIDENINSEDHTPKIMMNNVQRLSDLSDTMDIIKPDRKDLNIFFLMSCIESLFVLTSNGMQKQEMIINFYNEYTSEDDKRLIQDSIQISTGFERPPYYRNISMEEFSLMLSAIRNLVAHEGKYWNVQFMRESNNKEVRITNIIPSKWTKDGIKSDVTYNIGLRYNDFRRITIMSFINFINRYKIQKK